MFNIIRMFLQWGMIVRVIALQGKHDTGKTRTLKRLIEILKSNGFECERLIGKDPEKGEWRYWGKCCGVRIGITTRGDSVKGLKGDFYEKKYNFKDRDLVVCAVRSQGKTVEFVKARAQGGLEIYKKEIAAPEDQAAVNEKQAGELAEIINKTIAKWR